MKDCSTARKRLAHERSCMTSTSYLFKKRQRIKVNRPSTMKACRIIEFPKIHDPRGNLASIEGGQHVPFTIARVYYLYDVPGGESRAGHAHKALEQVLIAMSGSFDVIVDDRFEKRTFHLEPKLLRTLPPEYDVGGRSTISPPAQFAWRWPPPGTTNRTTSAPMKGFWPLLEEHADGGFR